MTLSEGSNNLFRKNKKVSMVVTQKNVLCVSEEIKIRVEGSKDLSSINNKIFFSVTAINYVERKKGGSGVGVEC